MIAPEKHPYRPSILIFGVGVVLSIVLLGSMVHRQHQIIRQDFARAASDRSAAVGEHVAQDFFIPEDIRQLFNASDRVSETQFAIFVSAILKRAPELDFVAWARPIQGADGKISYPIDYLEERKATMLRKGSDLFSLPGLDQAIYSAQASDSARWVALPARGGSKDEHSDWLIVLPVQAHALQSAASGEAKVSDDGIILVRINLFRMIELTLRNLERIGIDASLSDDTHGSRQILARWWSLTRKGPVAPGYIESVEKYAYILPISVGTAKWSMKSWPAPYFLTRYDWWEETFIFATSVILSGLLAIYSLRQRVSKNALLRQNQMISLLQNIAMAANEAPSNEFLLRTSLSQICGFLDWPFGHVYVRDETTGRLVSSGIYEIHGADRYQKMREKTDEMKFAAGEGIPGRVAQNAHPMFIPNVEEFSDFRRGNAVETGLHACFAFPVVVRSEVAAVMEFFHAEISQPFAGWKELLESISTSISHAMERRLTTDEVLEKSAVLENAVEGIAQVDAHGCYLSANRAYVQMQGIPITQLLGMDSRSTLHPADREGFEAAHARMVAEGRAEVESRCLRPDGSVYHLQLTMIRGLDRFGKFHSCHYFSRDVTQRQEQHEALRESEERFLAFMANSPASTSIKDENGRMLYVNPATTENFGLSQEQIYGKMPDDLFSPEAAEEIRKGDRKVLEDNKPVTVIETIPDRHGKIRKWIVFKFLMVSRDHKKLIGSLALDVTDRYEAEEAIIRARDEALESARMKSQFLANMSHEIRTPMNGLIGMLGLLEKTEMNAGQKDLVLTAASAADSLLRLLNDILDFSKIEAGKMELEQIPFDPRQCLRHATRILAEPARKKGLELTCRVADEVPLQLLGDSGRLAQVVVNLLNNGIKFTQFGSVSVELGVERWLYDSEVLLHAVVRDTGIGVSESHREIIFQPFQQSDNSTARQYGGTGLGLAICAQLVGLMSGEIWLESVPEGGSAFHFTMKMGISSEPLPSPRTFQTEVPTADRSLRILLAEDNEINQRLAITLLEERGHRIRLARNGYEAVALFQQETFDLILMDVQMPGMDGYQATREIRQHPLGKTIPIYAVTAHAMPEDRRRCIDIGMNDYLTKPIRVNEFARLVELKVNGNQSLQLKPPHLSPVVRTRRIELPPTRSIRPAENVEKPPTPSVPALDLAALRSLVGDNEDLIQQLASVFISQAGGDREKIQAALRERDAIGVEHSVHRLRGSALSLAATPLAKIAETIEIAARSADFASIAEAWSSFETIFDQLINELQPLAIVHDD